jgi:hypothetical protein
MKSRSGRLGSGEFAAPANPKTGTCRGNGLPGQRFGSRAIFAGCGDGFAAGKLFAHDGHVVRRVDADADAALTDPHDGYGDVFADQDALANFT